MKITLSTPSTSSSAINVTNAIHDSGCEIQLKSTVLLLEKNGAILPNSTKNSEVF